MQSIIGRSFLFGFVCFFFYRNPGIFSGQRAVRTGPVRRRRRRRRLRRRGAGTRRRRRLVGRPALGGGEPAAVFGVGHHFGLALVVFQNTPPPPSDDNNNNNSSSSDNTHTHTHGRTTTLVVPPTFAFLRVRSNENSIKGRALSVIREAERCGWADKAEPAERRAARLGAGHRLTGRGRRQTHSAPSWGRYRVLPSFRITAPVFSANADSFLATSRFTTPSLNGIG